MEVLGGSWTIYQLVMYGIRDCMLASTWVIRHMCIACLQDFGFIWLALRVYGISAFWFVIFS